MVGQSHPTTFLFFTTFLFICGSISAVRLPPRPNSTTTNDLDFIRTSCNATLYPDVCFTSLAGYASAVQDSPARLAKLAIGVSLSQAKSTAAYLSKLSRSAAVTSAARYSGDGHQTASAVIRDCVSNVEDAVDEMRGSLRQLRDMNGRGGVPAARRSVETFRFQMSNVQTWMSAALTDEDTCTDGFEDMDEGGLIKTTVCDRLEEVKRLTSNALALVNTYANNGAP
ncbi:Invertase/pectin methylesterase inhibitor domain superfamily [Arabidopsis thaliana x Arabidopsis arenosa]|uniref:Invertase/pectin methylesterase inhibitor domain superfamily n=1 Tax=Arabidopsis thaliana x Arabidopsis arenosa TaxID=1240361 RepID=A0A8T1ZI17_9BRAS|nr:Invertase/pectin methylesterase inhibitor domain superfamily [Arabidopsis thaliana x Arabidopsis arenosa]